MQRLLEHSSASTYILCTGWNILVMLMFFFVADDNVVVVEIHQLKGMPLLCTKRVFLTSCLASMFDTVRHMRIRKFTAYCIHAHLSLILPRISGVN